MSKRKRDLDEDESEAAKKARSRVRYAHPVVRREARCPCHCLTASFLAFLVENAIVESKRWARSHAL